MKKTIHYILIVLFIWSCKAEIETGNYNPINNDILLPQDTAKTQEKMTEELQFFSVVLKAINTKKAVVSTPMGGFMKYAPFKENDKVYQGSLMVILEHPDFIKLQQQFLECGKELEYYKKQFKRQGELTIEEASSIKKMEEAQYNYLKTEIRYLSIKKQLELIGIPPDSVHVDKLQSSIAVFSPLSGTITKSSFLTGQFADTDKTIFEITDLSTLMAEISVPQELLEQIKEKQKFKILFSNGKKIKASLTENTKTVFKIDENTGNALFVIEIENSQADLTPGMKGKAFLK